MKKTLLYLTITLVAFGFGLLTFNLFFLSSKPTFRGQIIRVAGDYNQTGNNNLNFCGFGSPETILFTVIEGDYNSQQSEQTWMYLDTHWEGEKPSVDGSVRVNAELYPLKPNSHLNPKTGEIHFETRKINQTFYVFTGEITQKHYSNGEIALVGILEKIKNRRVIKKTKHTFKFYYHVK